MNLRGYELSTLNRIFELILDTIQIIINQQKSEDNHYGDVKSFKCCKRRYSIAQVLCHNAFDVVGMDFTNTKYPSRWSYFKYNEIP